MKTLIVVDMQKDFIDGALGTKEAEKIVSKVKAKIKKYVKDGGNIIFTRDTHKKNYMETREGKYLPVPHCIKGTPGWEIPKVLTDAAGENAVIIDKGSFGYDKWPKVLKGMDPTEFEFVGLCTDICVVSNALSVKALYPEVNISVDAACCAGVTPAAHDAALATMRSCQIDIVHEGKEPWRG
ncbi:MAG: cysteine hydrolase [Clostridiales bacterium]|nr:cysteine hydrolase [Clostridiales bacterium]